MQMIDFFGGLHGNYLELLLNVFVYQNGYDITQPQFNANGACHLKDKNPSYTKIIRAAHYSYHHSCNKLSKFAPDHQVIKIVPTVDDMLIGITNSFLRAGDESFDLDNLEIDTLAKLKMIPKAEKFLTTLTNEHGVRTSYSRQTLRNYFYSMFDVQEYGLNMFTNFSPDIVTYYDFPFRAFFDHSRFYFELNNIARFLGVNFYPTDQLMHLHEEFLARNQGYHSEIKCHGLLADIWAGRSTAIDLNIVEEAWINWQIARSLRSYDLPILIGDTYPPNTRTISQAVFEWKSKDYPSNTS